MTCMNHPQQKTVANCYECGQPICAECLIHIDHKAYCQEHALAQLQQEKAPMTPSGHEGAPIPTHYSMTTVYPYKSRITATLLAVFLGWMGAHRYYLGKMATGALYTISFGFGTIGWIMDVIILIAGNPRDAHGQPLV